MATNRSEITVTDGSTKYNFTVFRNKDGRDFRITQRDWEADPLEYWKVALHPWDGGLGPDRLSNQRVYAKANMDFSYRGIAVPPPLVVSPTMPSGAQRGGIVTIRADASSLTSGATSITVTKPTGTVDNDTMVAFIYHQTIEAITAPAGWTLLTSNNSTQGQAETFSKVAASEGADYIWSAATSNIWRGYIVTFSSAGTITVEDVQHNTTNTSHITPSVTPTMAGSATLCFFQETTGASARTWTEPTDFLLLETLNNGSTQPFIAVFAQINTTAAYTATATLSTTASAKTAIVIINPPSNDTISFTANFTKPIQFLSKMWFAGGRYLVSINSSYVVAVERDFGSAITISDLEIFNGELIIALGASANIWKINSSGYYFQASDATYAVRLSTVGKNLWRSTSSTAISSCTTAPLTLSSWAAAYTVGDSSYDINVIIDYGSVVWVGKPDGFYVPDAQSNYFNQTPQLSQWPHSDNCTGAFVAEGYLWCPSVAGLLRIAVGESLLIGPELSERPAYRFWTRGGVEWSDAIYLIVNDQSAVDFSFLCKMQVDEFNLTGGRDYIYHEIARLGATTIPYAIGVFTAPTNPSLIIGQTTTLKYVKLGRGGGRQIDDPNYAYGADWEFETGAIQPNLDLALTTGLIGVIIVLDYDSTERLVLSNYAIESSGSWTNMLSTQEGGGAASIDSTTLYEVRTLYAAPNTIGQFFKFQFVGTQVSGSSLGTDRPEIREIWAFGYVRPRVTDLITINIYANKSAKVGGIPQGRNVGETLRLFRAWKRDAQVVAIDIPEYEVGRTTRFRVVEVAEDELVTTEGTSGMEQREAIIRVSFMRDDFAGVYANA